MVAIINDTLRNSQESRRHAKRAALYDLAASAVAALMRWNRLSREKHELAQLDWRELKDIGLTSSDVHALMEKPFWRV